MAPEASPASLGPQLQERSVPSWVNSDQSDRSVYRAASCGPVAFDALLTSTEGKLLVGQAPRLQLRAN